MKSLFGKVVSTKQTKTVVVEVERFFKIPIYEKRIRRTKKYQVHTEEQHNIGDVVCFIPTRPISKMKKWKVVANDEVKVKSEKRQSKLKKL